MNTCVFIGCLIIVILASISLICGWASKASNVVKIYCTLTLIISVSAFFCAYCRTPFEIKDGTGMIGVIATIVTIPVTILIGWNIFTALGIQKEIKDIKNAMKEENDKMQKQIENFKKDSNKKIDEIKSDRVYLNTDTDKIKIGKEGGISYLRISSDTKWDIYVNNLSKDSINGLRVNPLNGSGDATISVEYDGVNTENYQQSSTLVISYKSYGVTLSRVVEIFRKNLPH